MAYTDLINEIQARVYQNNNGDIGGGDMQAVLLQIVDTLGTQGQFMGILSANNKPTTTTDGKQFYIGYNTQSTAVTVNLSSVGLGTLTITQERIYIVHNLSGSWAAVNIVSGLAATIPHAVSELSDGANYAPKPDVVYLEGATEIAELRTNTVYIADGISRLIITRYGYNTDDDVLNEPPSIIVVHPNDDFEIAIPSPAAIREGDSLRLVAETNYIITVHGIYWKVEGYINQE